MMMRSVSGWPSCIGVMSHNLAIYASSNNSFIFFNDTATTEIYTLSLHDALPILFHVKLNTPGQSDGSQTVWINISEEHTSELQSQSNLVCRLLLEQPEPFLI